LCPSEFDVYEFVDFEPIFGNFDQAPTRVLDSVSRFHANRLGSLAVKPFSWIMPDCMAILALFSGWKRLDLDRLPVVLARCAPGWAVNDVVVLLLNPDTLYFVWECLVASNFRSYTASPITSRVLAH